MEFGFWGFIWNRGRAGEFDYLRRIDIKKTKIGRIDLGEVCLSQWDWIRQRMIGRVAAQLQTAEFGKSVHHLVFFSIAAFPSGQLADILNWEQKAFCFWIAALPSGHVTDSGNSAQKAFCFAITFFPSGQLADIRNWEQKAFCFWIVLDSTSTLKTRSELVRAMNIHLPSVPWYSASPAYEFLTPKPLRM